MGGPGFGRRRQAAVNRMGKDSTMTSRHLKVLVVATALSLSGCAINDAGPAEFSFEKITISNPLTSADERAR